MSRVAAALGRGPAAALLAALALGAGACLPTTSGPDASVADGGDGLAHDGPPADAFGDADATVLPDVLQNPCPPPARLRPEDLPASRFLPPTLVTYRYAVDGDTSSFIFPDAGEQVVRFLWLNTEEAHGEEVTKFGIQTAPIVRSYLASAREVVVAVEEDFRRPGEPHLDPFDRWLGVVFVDGELLETRIIREGLSAYYTRFGCAPEPIHSALVFAEAEARAAQRGIWQPGHPTDYSVVLEDWIPEDRCRPNPYFEPYCL